MMQAKCSIAFIIPDILLLSRLYAAKAIHPAILSFHNPAMSPEIAVLIALDFSL